jgi:glycosyltransferase involved in cell wall biosynthesis
MKTLSIDLTPLQGPHRMRGVGYVVINFFKNMTTEQRDEYRFILFMYEQSHEDVLEIAGIDSSFNYELRFIERTTFVPKSIKTFGGLLQIPVRLFMIIEDRFGLNHRLGNMRDIDTHLQFEQDVTPPSPRFVKTTVIAYDLIPYILERDYLWSYKTARQVHHYSRRGAFLAHMRRLRYLSTIREVMKRSNKIIAISGHTKQDFVRLLHVPASKITTVHLGAGDRADTKELQTAAINRYVGSSWGDIKTQTKLPSEKFLLFVGGADPRRRLSDLVAGYNLLRAQGYKIALVLAGDTMFGPNSLPNFDAAKAVQSSSYKDDIYFLGFVSDEVKEWLYENALAFVYPSRYEGFGLPVLEAMRYGTPVITYDNSSIREIANNAALYAHEYTHIAEYAKELLNDPTYKNTLKEASINQAGKFSWHLTVTKILQNL